MPGRPECHACPFGADPEVVCAALRTGARGLCDLPRMAEAVRRLTLQPLGRYVAPVYRRPTPSFAAPETGATAGGPPVVAPVARQLVVARYRESVAWLAGVPPDYDIVVYNCGAPLGAADGWPPAREGCPPGVAAREVRRPNVADEAGAYCRHIADRYDELALLTVFCQARVEDHCPDFLDRLKASWDRPTSLATRYAAAWPPSHVTLRDHVEVHHGFQVRYGRIEAHPSNREPWDDLFDCPRPDPWLFGYSALWAVPWWAIRARPHSFWRWLRREVEASCTPGVRANPATRGLHGYFMEIAWGFVFMPPALYPHREHCSA